MNNEKRISETLANSARPLTAAEIANICGLTKSDVNGVLHRKMGDIYDKDRAKYTWSLVKKAKPLELGEETNDTTKVEVYFSPADNPISELCDLIVGAETSIHIQAFYLKSERISKKLIEAKKRDVSIRILLGCTSNKRRPSRKPEDRHGGTKHFVPMSLHKSKIVVLEDWGDSNNHNKCVVIDRKITVTGGLNFCDFAEDNADNMVVIRNREVASCFLSDWTRNAKFGAPFGED